MIGERIKRLRKKKGYSIAELSRLADVSKSYLSYIERDLYTNPSIKFLSKIAEQLDTNVESLLEVENAKTRSPFPKGEKLDGEWKKLITTAINEGMTKEEFKDFREYLKFKNWQQNH